MMIRPSGVRADRLYTLHTERSLAILPADADPLEQRRYPYEFCSAIRSGASMRSAISRRACFRNASGSRPT